MHPLLAIIALADSHVLTRGMSVLSSQAHARVRVVSLVILTFPFRSALFTFYSICNVLTYPRTAPRRFIRGAFKGSDVAVLVQGEADVWSLRQIH